MDNAVGITLLAITLPVIGGGIGFLIKHNIEKKKELMNEVTKTRRDLYQQFVDMIIDIFANTKTDKQLPMDQLLTKQFDFYKKYVLYASSDVINTYADYFQYLYSFTSSSEMKVKEHFRKLTRILASMRKDLGLRNRKLGKDGERLFRALLTDFDKYF